MWTQTKTSLLLLLTLTVITGALYPLAVTGMAQVIFPDKANGSLIFKNGHPVGSTLIGQPFDDPKYFWGGHPPPGRFPIMRQPLPVPISARPMTRC